MCSVSPLPVLLVVLLLLALPSVDIAFPYTSKTHFVCWCGALLEYLSFKCLLFMLIALFTLDHTPGALDCPCRMWICYSKTFREKRRMINFFFFPFKFVALLKYETCLWKASRTWNFSLNTKLSGIPQISELLPALTRNEQKADQIPQSMMLPDIINIHHLKFFIPFNIFLIVNYDYLWQWCLLQKSWPFPFMEFNWILRTQPLSG